jgi:hypothetical protein
MATEFNVLPASEALQASLRDLRIRRDAVRSTMRYSCAQIPCRFDP